MPRTASSFCKARKKKPLLLLALQLALHYDDSEKAKQEKKKMLACCLPTEISAHRTRKEVVSEARLRSIGYSLQVIMSEMKRSFSILHLDKKIKKLLFSLQ